MPEQDTESMNRKFHTKIDPIEQAIELALNPGSFIPDRASITRNLALLTTASSRMSPSLSSRSKACRRVSISNTRLDRS